MDPFDDCQGHRCTQMGLTLERKNLFTSRSDRVKCVDFHPTEPWVLVALYSGHVNIWNYHTQSLVKTIEVCDQPVRTARFIARKNWVITGSDDLTIRVFNYHTLERVASFDGHSDYVRKMAVHPVKPLVLSASDDMTVKLWDWEKGWKCLQTFEGHQHYVMDVAFNPKDPSTFATASLDRTIKVWSLSSPKANYTLEGHSKGVNSLAYYGGADKPYLVSGADDTTVRIWDYQNKACVRVLEGHQLNVSSVMFHPELPLIMSGSEDCTLKVWSLTTFRLEASYSMTLDRIWSLAHSMAPGSSEIAIGCDDGILVLQLGKGEPAASMDGNGKVIWAKHHEVLTTTLRSPSEDGERILAPTKELGQCELFPQMLQHSPSGRFVAVCGDGEYIVYSAVAWRNRAYGKALDFCWANSSNGTTEMYCIRESSSRLVVHSNFAEVASIRTSSGCERLFGGNLIGAACSGSQLCFYDWTSTRLLRRIDVEATAVHWCPATNKLAICTADSAYLLQYHPVPSDAQIPEDGIEEAFEVIGEISEKKIVSAVWLDGTFIYSTASGRIAYQVGSSSTQLATTDSRPLYILGACEEGNRLVLTDKDANLYSYSIPIPAISYEAAVLKGDLQAASRLLPSIPAEQRNRLAHFLASQGMAQEALHIASDPSLRFDLALSDPLPDLQLAHQLLTDTPDISSPHRWRLLGDRALALWKLPLAEECFWRAADLTSLLLLYSASGNQEGMARLADAAADAGEQNIAFTCLFATGRITDCYDLLMASGDYADAATFARAHLPSKVDEAVAAWTSMLSASPDASHVELQAAQALALPSKNPELFLLAQSIQKASSTEPIPIAQPADSSRVSFDHSVDPEPSYDPQPSLATSLAYSDSYSMEVNTTGTGSINAQPTISDDLDDLTSLKTFTTAATANTHSETFDRLTIHPEHDHEYDEHEHDHDDHDGGLSRAELDEELNPRPSPAQLFTSIVPPPPVPPFHHPTTATKDDEHCQDEGTADIMDDIPIAADEKPISPLQSLAQEDDWL